MWAFERYNKKVKDMVQKNSSAEESIATNALLETAIRFVEMAADVDDDDEITDLRKRRTTCSIQSIRVQPCR